MLKVLNHRRRLLRKNMYKAPHSKTRRNLIKKAHPKKYNKPTNEPNIKFLNKKPKRVNKGYKMSYRYKYYNIVEEDENNEESES